MKRHINVSIYICYKYFNMYFLIWAFFQKNRPIDTKAAIKYAMNATHSNLVNHHQFLGSIVG